MLELFFIGICLFINALLAGSEAAFIAVSKSSLKALIRQGNEKAKLLLEMRENPERTLSVMQIGISFVGAFAAAIGGAGAGEKIAPWLVHHFGLKETSAELLSILLVVLPLTFASVVLGELVPKTLALRRSLSFSFVAAPWINFASRILYPTVILLEWTTKQIIALFPKKHTAPEDQEISSLDLENLISPLNKQYMVNLVKIEKTSVAEIMVKWDSVVSVNIADPIENVAITVISSGHTRLPILKDEEVIGILNSKEFFAFQKSGNSNWPSLARPIVAMQESVPILTALRILQEKHTHMGIIYLGTAKKGIVTMEAIFEEIIGDIYDEDDDGAIQKILSSRRHFK
ncbi:putative uncharacterized protein [Parachlamydia acanthamoebae UV-7]|uniref:CNNM transmembrane domain-containing protein n=2 Tax=Parachlamydia acanthamoebae TaxID=83552 RepID=F8KVF2_PARAV|nr:hemolysin family protein [Parachlamydia acanthamoebae]CCB87680.1 putative uncharacterized protein [Parachlamydia acanthamoebae UV-7]